MPASITIYNDSDTARDVSVTIIPGHSQMPAEHRVIPAKEEGGDSHTFELDLGDILIVKRID